jgi:hypothetical protein
LAITHYIEEAGIAVKGLPTTSWRQFRFKKKIMVANLIVVLTVARFFLVQNTQTGKIYQISIKYTTRP